MNKYKIPCFYANNIEEYNNYLYKYNNFVNNINNIIKNEFDGILEYLNTMNIDNLNNIKNDLISELNFLTDNKNEEWASNRIIETFDNVLSNKSYNKNIIEQILCNYIINGINNIPIDYCNYNPFKLIKNKDKSKILYNIFYH